MQSIKVTPRGRVISTAHPQKTAQIARLLSEPWTGNFKRSSGLQKKMASKIERPADLGELESYLTKSRKEIDRKSDGTWAERKPFRQLECEAPWRDP
jgi:hypothetical protein